MAETSTAAKQLPVDNRQRRRSRVLKAGAILVDVDTSEVRCTLRDQTESGAELRVPIGTAVPAEFLLYVPFDGIAYRSVIRWRAGTRIGVMFRGTEPKPAWHYG
ncbi:MAG: PilZ domain-containing protein [Rhizobiaceae bacterium]|nr:PilZ domain-containing protein [Rhizobiaceae bacterium]